MKKVLTGALVAAAVAGATLATTIPAQAHGDGGAAVAAGIVGLGVGAALASGGPRYYAPPPAYYAEPGYYGRPAYYEGCRTAWRWSPRWGHYERVRYCY